MRILLALLLLTLIPLAHSADVTLTWTAPTANSDGSVPALIGGYNVYQASTEAALAALPDTQHGGKTLSVGKVLTTTLRNLAPGSYVFAVTTWYCDASGCSESRQSSHVSTTVGPSVITATPGAPVGVKITVTVGAP